MDIQDRLIVWCLALLDQILDFFTFGAWSDVQGADKANVKVKQ
jgi:hypothetical protein